METVKVLSALTAITLHVNFELEAFCYSAVPSDYEMMGDLIDWDSNVNYNWLLNFASWCEHVR